ncbi:MAG: TIGR02436 family protein [Microgenomates group bacterium GW2011_GWC1_46_16]|uniref:Four helix bundle protein n=2 Tax=Candidatus Collieribacteriota TaxID=1752725 RepID=A0A1F5FYT6_9BACT|nr:MAG: TIGR02436 family protein [Microgenomates group bacterium GW2011_GWF1_46_12]KKU26758.1 MAG: TIGR02436 family protein [Microgenomates group bacterium GW2011_GWC1_46_16]KKU27992.1 MAG: TIGR02436 family protein [Microgenomates group bacterium GW2011_GWF2_46_18]KKU44227.1 MAG: TIGR02436 family protein [Microgenomates group bacterium GW2011_GWA1_46_7]KKU45666.1 MAG: TIGR02436 family protein [Microgenomates group bacterium GW2011_GWB1_46_7]KKU61329.1 MAG: TIGR02436 family protein [Microgenoma
MVKDFTDLLVWQKAHSMVVMIYQLVSNFPKFEQYGLSDQMRRSAVSVTSNIAEGFGRQTAKEKGQYYYLAKGSLTELRNQLYVARDVGYVTLTEVNKILIIMEEVYKMLFGLIKTTKLSIPTS